MHLHPQQVISKGQKQVLCVVELGHFKNDKAIEPRCLVKKFSRFPFYWPIYMYKVKKPEISIKKSWEWCTCLLVLWVLGCSQPCSWAFQSSGMLTLCCRVRGFQHLGWTYCLYIQGSSLDCLTTESEGTAFLQKSGTTHQWQQHVPKD